MLDTNVLEELVPNPTTMIVQLLSTLVLFLIFKKFLWKSVKNFFAVRAERMQTDLAESENAKRLAQEDRDAAHLQLQEASKRSESIVNAAVKEAKDQKEQILSEANKEADATRKKAQEQIEADRLAMQDAMKKEMVDVAMSAAGKLIGETNAEEMDQKAIDAFIKEATSHEE